MEKQKLKEEQEKKLLEQRTQYLEKTKNLLKIEIPVDEEPAKKNRRVSHRRCRVCDFKSTLISCLGRQVVYGTSSRRWGRMCDVSQR